MWRISLTIVFGAWCLVLPCGCDSTRASRTPAGTQAAEVFDGVTHVHRVHTSPRRIEMHIVVIDLRNPHIRFQVTEGIDGQPGMTRRETTRAFVQRLGAQVGINGGFFDNRIPSSPITRLISLCVSAGRPVSPWDHRGRHMNHGVNIGPDNVVTFVEQAADDANGFMTDPPVVLHNALAGNMRLIRTGKILARPGGDPTYPQTALGLNRDHQLLLFVADGRQPARSAGMTYAEVAEVLQEFGAVDAIALDGGGSATLVLADGPAGRARVVNSPADGAERTVGNNLAVFAAPLRK